MNKTINLAIGLGDLKFGMYTSSVEELLGKPNDTDEYSYEDSDEKAISWHYDELDISLGFEDMEGWVLVTIAISSSEYLLDNEALVGKTKDELLSFLEKIGLTELEEEELNIDDDVTQSLISAPDAGLDIWLENGLVSEIQISALFEE